MGLISFQFTIFICITAAAYFLFPRKYRWCILLAASWCYYLIQSHWFIFYLLLTTASTWAGGLAISKLYRKQKTVLKEHKGEWSREEKKQYKAKVLGKSRSLMIAVLLLNFGILAVLKYSGFTLSIVQNLMNLVGVRVDFPDPGFLLPLGISFYTFQSTGYLIDVYNEKTEAEKNFARFALFVSFFPQIIQGPIAIYEDLAHQLYEPHDFSFENLKNSAALVLWGAFKKMVVADRAVKFVNYISEDSSQYTGTMILAAVLLYALQLYADFSGGIDIVRGIGELFDIEMAENFRRPYFSASLTEYWHRWHITLGNWVRTYVFYPLSISPRFLKMGKAITNRFGKHLGKVVPTSIASLITFLIIGIWHGANGKYVAFGLWNGTVIMLIEIFRPANEKVFDFLHIRRDGRGFHLAAIFWTFILVLIGYYFDIAQNFTDAIHMLCRTISDFHLTDLLNPEWFLACGLNVDDYLAILVGGIIIFAASLIQEKTGTKIRDRIWAKRILYQWLFLWAGIFSVVIFGYYGPNLDPAAFVYMQF